MTDSTLPIASLVQTAQGYLGRERGRGETQVESCRVTEQKDNVRRASRSRLGRDRLSRDEDVISGLGVVDSNSGFSSCRRR